MTDELDLLLNNKERQQHEGYIVTRLMDRHLPRAQTADVSGKQETLWRVVSVAEHVL